METFKELTQEEMQLLNGGRLNDNPGGYSDGYGSINNPIQLGDVVVTPRLNT